jgi:hypothetical protein
MPTLKIHGLSPSPFTRTVRMACHEKGIDYEMVDALPNTIGPLNPFAKIPAITHGDLTLFESIAILRYFERVFPGPKLWPDDAVAAALCDQWASAVSDSLVNAALRYFAARAGFLPVPAEMAQKYLDKTAEVRPISISIRSTRISPISPSSRRSPTGRRTSTAGRRRWERGPAPPRPCPTSSRRLALETTVSGIT